MNERYSGGAFPYFPPLYGEVSCGKCELYGQCPNGGKFQRNRRDFSVISGRCPRLPDGRGFMEREQQELYAEIFPLIHAKREEERLHLELQIPCVKRRRTVYRAKSGYWYFRDRFEGEAVKRAITIQGASNKKDILNIMSAERTSYCVFRCTIEDYFI